MEWFDVVDENGIPTGETVERSEAHARDILHRTAHIWVVRKMNGRIEVLLQKRSMNKDSFPGRYDTSSAGHIQAGDEPRDSAIRELHEELGIQAQPEELEYAGMFRIHYDMVFHDRPFKDNEVSFVYVYRKPADIEKLTLQKEEVESVRWFSLDEVCEGVMNHDETYCVPSGGLETLKAYLSTHAGSDQL
ncbi:MAG: NUDIX domain-containing protein [Solobacterium sp.]|nr:NUDIX domain-containing protein [Solobacterium sp.]MBR3344705.1 NUDIX domain-containing protein [Solobacterium sp.]